MHENHEQLVMRIMDRIHQEQRVRQMKRRAVFYSMSVVAVIPTFAVSARAFVIQCLQSDMFQYISFLFTDVKITTTYFGDIMLTVLESVPAASCAWVTMLLVVLLFCVNQCVYALFTLKKLNV